MNQNFEALAIKVLDGDSTVAERVALHEFLDAHPEERALFDEMLADAKLLRADARAEGDAPPALSAAIMSGVSHAILSPARVSLWRVGFVLACGAALLTSSAIAAARVLPPETWLAQLQVAISTIVLLFEGVFQSAAALAQGLARLMRILSRQPMVYASVLIAGAMIAAWAGVLRRAVRLATA